MLKGNRDDEGGNVNEPPVRNVPRVQGLLTPCRDVVRGLIFFPLFFLPPPLPLLYPEYELQPLSCFTINLILLLHTLYKYIIAMNFAFHINNKRHSLKFDTIIKTSRQIHRCVKIKKQRERKKGTKKSGISARKNSSNLFFE